MTISCKDADHIPKVSDAGCIKSSGDESVQIMHNGIKVIKGGYHGDWMAHIIRALKGHHEPQEEAIFHEILRSCRNDSLIVELGSFWSYYSMWYLHEIPGSEAICVEPDPQNLDIGQRNAQLNRLSERIKFVQACAARQEEPQVQHFGETVQTSIGIPALDFNAVLKLCGDKFIEVLHLDIQGAELDFLLSLESAVSRNRLRFVFVSTHHSSISGSKTTHEDCLEELQNLGASILVHHSVQQSYSGDGLIVASFLPDDAEMQLPHISFNVAEKSLFRTR